MNANGLRLDTIKSEVKPVSVQVDLLKTVIEHFPGSSAFVAAYLDYRVLIGKFENDVFALCENETIDAKFVQRLRVFNHDRELLIWRSKDGLKGRLRIDESGKDTDVVDAGQVLFGTKAESMSNFTRLTEDRGTEIILPFANINVDDKKKRVCVKTRNYIEYNSITHQATYIDCRFVGFSCASNNLGGN
jgi:CRISPR-associated protein (TIGR03984 family)